MLSKIWNKAVRLYQNEVQMADESRLTEIDQRIERARKGYQESVVVSPRVGLVSVHRYKLSDEDAKAIIKAQESMRAETLQRMQERRERYGLKI